MYDGLKISLAFLDCEEYNFYVRNKADIGVKKWVRHIGSSTRIYSGRTNTNAPFAGRYMTSRMPFARIATLRWAVQNMTLIGSTKWPDMMKYSATIDRKKHSLESRSSLRIKGLRLC